jgi:intracellular multiplication protein IcmG
MVDNDHNNDEYQLNDLDLLAVEPEDQVQTEAKSESDASSAPTDAGAKQFDISKEMIRNALIVIGGIVLLVLCYKFVGSFFSSKKSAQPEIIPVAVKKIPTNNAVNQSMTQQMPFASDSAPSSQVSKKLSTLEQDQQTMNANVQSINTQLNGMSSTVSDMATKMAELSNVINALNDKIEAQSHEIERLHAPKPRPIARVRKSLNTMDAPASYVIQAVIPGRAWLMTGNGSTLTVREGTSIAGYGVVKLIDPLQGRVVTSSGRIIRFSQTDS